MYCPNELMLRNVGTAGTGIEYYRRIPLSSTHIPWILHKGLCFEKFPSGGFPNYHVNKGKGLRGSCGPVSVETLNPKP